MRTRISRTRGTGKDEINKRGVVLIAVLVALSLLIVMMSVTLQWALRNRRDVRKQLVVTQTNWLCDAGLQRAVRKLKMDAAYEGEQWNPVFAEHGQARASVVISVDSREHSKWIRVVAEINQANSDHQRIQRTLEHLISLNRESINEEGTK